MIEAMIKFMGYFLVIVAILKIIDWKKFSENFSKYDLIAKRSQAYSFSYPIIELAIGISFLNNFYVREVAIVLAAIMFIGVTGVLKALKENKKVQCACLGKLGHKLNIKLTQFTLFEDIVMGLMALAILLL